MALGAYAEGEVRRQIVGDLVLAVSMVLLTDGDLGKLAGPVGVYRSLALRHGLDWAGVVTEVRGALGQRLANTRVFFEIEQGDG